MPVSTSLFRGDLELHYLIIVYVLLAFSVYPPQVFMARSSESLEELSSFQNFGSRIGGWNPLISENEHSEIGGYDNITVKKDHDLGRLYEKISELEMLPYNNTEIYEWESEVLGLLKAKGGNSSDCYEQFLSQTQHGFWRSGALDRRMILSTPELYQHEYESHLQGYRVLLEQCMNSIN